MKDSTDQTIAPLVQDPPRATSFIVTLYGDLVEPRGGTIWMGSVIDICAAVGLTETHVRTSVSRLVANGQLEGMKVGRRSYYRLTDSAQQDFASAARTIYAPPVEPATSWVWVMAPTGLADALRRRGFATVGPDIYLGPDRELTGLAVTATWRCPIAEGALQSVVRKYWDIDAAARVWTDFIHMFGRKDFASLDPEECLIQRLMLVHHFRFALRSDPNLPIDAVGPNWPGLAARRLFAEIYCGLSQRADQATSSMLVRLEGPVPQETDATIARLRALCPL